MTTSPHPAPDAAASGAGTSTRAADGRRGAGIAALVGSAIGNQSGAALGALAFPVIGAVGVVAIRQLVAAAALATVARPRFRDLDRTAWWLVAALAVTFGTMNLTLYTAIDRLGLGLAVTLEFLGPLAVAIASSRRAVDLVCALAAGAGVVVLAQPGPSVDVIGILIGLCSAAAWASYILLNRALGRRLPGLRAASAAATCSAAAWLVPGVVWLWFHPPTLAAILLALACGLLSSAVPFAIDLFALRRVPAEVCGTLMAINPAFAALAGWVLLGQVLGLPETIGLGLVVLAGVTVTGAPRRTRGPLRGPLRGPRRAPDGVG